MKETVEINKTNDLSPQDKQSEVREQLDEILKNKEINKPSEEEIEQFKNEYEILAKTFQEGLWEVGVSDTSTDEGALDGQTIIDFIRHFSRTRHIWKGTEWMGVIKLQEALDQVENQYHLDKTHPIAFEYKAIEFIFHMLQNPGGIGYESAVSFEEDAKLYGAIFDEFAITLKAARAALQDIDFAQQKWAAAAQGFYLEKDSPIPEPTENENNGIYFDEELQRDVKPGEPEYNIAKFQQMMHEKYGGLEDPLTQKINDQEG